MLFGRSGRLARLPSGKDFRRAFDEGRKQVGRGMILWCVDNAPRQEARLGLAISAKAGPAVERNRFKRLAREAFRLNSKDLRPCDVVIYIRPGCRWRVLYDAETEFAGLCRKAEIFQHS